MGRIQQREKDEYYNKEQEEENNAKDARGEVFGG
jgi:hypothetical protein